MDKKTTITTGGKIAWFLCGYFLPFISTWIAGKQYRLNSQGYRTARKLTKIGTTLAFLVYITIHIVEANINL